MSYYLNLFSPETYEAFGRSAKEVSGFTLRQSQRAARVQKGDKLLCYLTRLSRWMGVLEVCSAPFEDSTPIFYDENDPYVVRFKVRPIVWLSKEKAIPIKDDRIWDSLSFTKGQDKHSPMWTGRVRASLAQLDDVDGQFLEQTLLTQMKTGEVFEVDETEYQKWLTRRIRAADRVVAVTVPDDPVTHIGSASETHVEVRDSIKMQAMVANIGARMGMSIWIPRNDKAAVMKEWGIVDPPVLDVLPLNYDETTIKTIERIDVLWLRKRSIIRAFEVEHTTSIYSGLLRMADLLALQPNMDIKLHIVAPDERKEDVLRELQRPVFSLLDRGPLYESCTYISYGGLRELAALKHLELMSDRVLDEYAETE